MSRSPGAGRVRLQLECRGVIQGVGFRPLVHRLACDLELSGEVENGPGVVRLQLEGERAALETFLRRLPLQLPPGARLERLDPLWLPAPGRRGGARPPGVRILGGAAQPLGIDLVAAALVADRAPCSACLAELADPADRRCGYPFISCCDCGPRFSLATAEPWARAQTTLAPFPLCPACRREFLDPADRRFHAETIACPVCGPRLALWDGAGRPLAAADGDGSSAGLIGACCERLAAGEILALQGVGGFQLLVDATNAEAVARLRRRKRRPAKPFALLVAEADAMASYGRLEAEERRALVDPAAPIVLLRRLFGAPEALPGVAPGSPCLGAMLPASPLHHLLARAFGRPLVATSGNPSGEPLCTDPSEALERLGDGSGSPIADVFLVHDRAIARPLDDSVLQLIDGRPALLRRARGYAPEPLPLVASPGGMPQGVVALGGDLKSAPALALNGRLWLAPHLGDLAEGRLLSRLAEGLAAIEQRWGEQVTAIACDAHPGYLSHQLAADQRWPRQTVQHHRAHGLAVLAEHGLRSPLLAVTWDGLGYAPAPAADGGPQLWGGELLLLDGAGVSPCERLVALRPFPLPGGERAMAEPRRAALGLLAAAGSWALAHPGARHTLAAFSAGERPLLLQAIASGCNSPLSTSVGRLFDAVASLLGLVQVQSYEGEGGLRLQGAAASAPAELARWPLPLVPPGAVAGGTVAGGPSLGWLDWEPLLEALLAAIAAGKPPALCAARFHHALASALAETAALAVALRGPPVASSGGVPVALAGGCFQNRLLLEAAIAALRARGLQPFWPEAVPCNDGGLALGQIWAVGGPWADPASAPTTGWSVHEPNPPHVPGRARSHPLDPDPAAAGGA
ncbi:MULTISPECIES: carbamoyltransferase HypF [unclassified Cyanobium]|uniref:carbamoyltransferase HypF n=1 Tax=unclassified Cyanobium TaxID=2627006 RepID=UPI0020CD4771|nr:MULTISPECIES: carbamoyltransferase HypF [unclassified Cyanobium]MCP9833004.1 carbamoyltransferase HypF [Cyanobium sp. La Preciosa 7G6]MCP9935754.1 carbamoyltransferase HypF [Cyanobium sp. Aljojuca 7A6]